MHYKYVINKYTKQVKTVFLIIFVFELLNTNIS